MSGAWGQVVLYINNRRWPMPPGDRTGRRRLWRAAQADARPPHGARHRRASAPSIDGYASHGPSDAHIGSLPHAAGLTAGAALRRPNENEQAPHRSDARTPMRGRSIARGIGVRAHPRSMGTRATDRATPISAPCHMQRVSRLVLLSEDRTRTNRLLTGATLESP